MIIKKKKRCIQNNPTLCGKLILKDELNVIFFGGGKFSSLSQTCRIQKTLQ